MDYLLKSMRRSFRVSDKNSSEVFPKRGREIGINCGEI